MKHPRRSGVYLFFKETDDTHFQCLFPKCSCRAPKSADGTSNLRKHLRLVHPEAHAKLVDMEARNLELDEDTVRQLLHNEKRGQVTLETAFAASNIQKTSNNLQLLTWIICDGLPFVTTDSFRFHDWMKTFHYRPPSSRHLRRYLPLLHEASESIVLEKLSELDFVSIAMDEWSSENLVSYLSIVITGYNEK
eukprot:m51a1_g4522 hypothetical protein (192) ;mRNA; r:441337-441912